jgi:hypothetical protein
VIGIIGFHKAIDFSGDFYKYFVVVLIKGAETISLFCRLNINTPVYKKKHKDNEKSNLTSRVKRAK